MRRLALLLPLLALAAAPARAADPATNPQSDDLRLIVTEQAFAGERLTFQLEAWHCIDSTNGTVVSLLPWLAEDGCGDGSTAFTMPQRTVVFRAISNQADRVRLLHATPVRVRTGDRADLVAPGFNLAASVVENRPGIGLTLLRDASSARESGTFPTPGAQSDFMSYSDVTRCFVAPSAGEGSPLAFLFLTVSGPFAESAEAAPRANPVVAAPAQADPATNALPAGLPGLYHSRGRPYSSGLVEIDESGRMSAEARDAKWHPVPATQRKLSPVGTIRPAPEAGPGLLAFTSDEIGPDGKRGVGHLAFDADRLAIHWLAYDKEHARPWMVEFAETGFFYDPREDLIRLDTDLATLWCDTIYRTEPSDGGVSEIVYSLWDHVGNLSPQQRRDLDEILARKIHSLSICRAMMHLDDDLGAPLRNPYDGKPDPILDVSPDLRPAITKIIAPATNAAPAHPATK